LAESVVAREETVTDRSAASVTAPPRVPLSTHLHYSLGMMAPSALVVFSRSFLLFFYSQVVGLDAWLAGIALTIGRVWDAISDPLMGAISDRTRSRWGRRRPYIIFGALPLALSYVALWVPPLGWSQMELFVYLVATDILFNTLVTVVTIPYTSLGAELSTDYHERTRVTAIRMLFYQVGWFIGAVGVRVNQMVIDAAKEIGGVWGTVLSFREGYAMCAVVFGALTVVTLVWSGWAVREAAPSSERMSMGYIGSYMRTLKNRAFMIIVVAFLLASLFESIGFSIFPFLIGFWYYQGDMEAMNNNLLWLMMPLFFVTFPAVWFWTVVSRRIGKKPAMLAGAAATALTIALHYPMITPHHPALIWVIMILFGWAIASVNFLISAAIPDIVDEEELATGGIRREGSFFGMQSFVSKLGGALGLALVGGVLSLIGFEAGERQQSEQTLDWIRILFSYFRALGYFVAFLLLIAYPLTQARVAATRVALNARAMGAAQSQR
jgi:GPH family glycoside/pentoside/hexuronide:cation symporter